MTSSKLTWLRLTTPWSHPKDFFCDSDLRGRQHPSFGRQRNALWKSHFQQDILSSPCIVFCFYCYSEIFKDWGYFLPDYSQPYKTILPLCREEGLDVHQVQRAIENTLFSPEKMEN